MMKTLIVCLWLALVPFFGCTGGDATSLYETALLEEKQNSLDHAKQLYEEILEKYPDSAVAADAKRRLKALE